MLLSINFPIQLLLLLSLAILSLSSDVPNNMTAVDYHLERSNRCILQFGRYTKAFPDTCISIAYEGYQILRVLRDWPLCSNGTDAKFGIFEASNCEGSMAKPLLDKENIDRKCVGLKPSWGSFSFWCDGPEPLEYKPPTDEQRKGGLFLFPGDDCTMYTKPEPKYHAPDTCVDIRQGQGLEFIKPATCKNGTRAMAAGFKEKGCDPTDEPLKDPFSEWDDSYMGICIPTDDIQSMAFWCDGFDGIDMTKARKKGGNLGLILGLSLGLGGLVVLGGGLVVAYYTNWHFRTWVQVSDLKSYFGKRGLID
jgi:hypothetical protein